MKTRSIFLIILAIFALGIGVFVSLQQKKQPKQTEPVIVKTASSPPAIILVENAPKNVVFTFLNPFPEFPTSLPTYQIQPSVLQNSDITAIAASFGFTSPPIRKSVGQSSQYGWSLPSKTLSLFTDSSSQNWSFSAQTPIQLIDTPNTETGAISAAIQKIFPFPNGLQLSLVKKTNGPFDGLQTEENVQLPLTGLSFSTIINNTYPLVSQGFDPLPVNAIVDNQGKLLSLSFSQPPVITPTEEKPLLSAQDAVASLNKNLGILVFAGRTTGNAFWGDNPTFQSVSLTTVSLVYYQQPTANTAVPFFLFDGTAKTNENITTDVRYAVSAIE